MITSFAPNVDLMKLAVCFKFCFNKIDRARTVTKCFHRNRDNSLLSWLP